MTTEFEELKRQIMLRQEVLLRQINITVIRRTEEFAESAIRAIGDISVNECIDGIKRFFCEEMDKLK